MLLEQGLFSFSLLHLVNSHFQINLHLTDWVREDRQHDCLQVPAHVTKESDPRQIISYCMTELPSKFLIKENSRDQTFTFEQLAKRKITNQQLYLWSAPIDLIEQYQFYLNQLAKSQKSSLGSEQFYNCTLPYFGPQCSYVLEDHQPCHSSLDEIIHDYYRHNKYEPTLLTCYMHLECNRGPSPNCLDWSEICDGKMDCLDSGYDEEHCWQLENQEYLENVDPLFNRKCISDAFFRDESKFPNCLDESNALLPVDVNSNDKNSPVLEPTFKQEDISYTKYIQTEKYMRSYGKLSFETRTFISFQAMFSIKPKWLPVECWSAFTSLIKFTNRMNALDYMICDSTLIDKIIIRTCPNITLVPAVPVLLGHIYAAYDKDKLLNKNSRSIPRPTYYCYDDQRLYVSDNDNKKIFLNNNTCRFNDAVGHSPATIKEINWYRQHIILLATHEYDMH